MKIIILGAGFAGLSTAYYLQKSGIKCEVFEKEERVGGVCRTEISRGFTFDHCGHLLHFRNQDIKKLIRSLVSKKLVKHTRQSWIYSKGVYTRYPFQSNLYGLPEEVIEECLLGFVEARKKMKSGSKRRIRNFEEWVYSHFGKGIAKHFMIPYNQKLWTVPLREPTTHWMGRFIPRVSLKDIIHGATTDSKTLLGYNITFDYPRKGGIESVAEALASRVEGVETQKAAMNISISRRNIQFTGEPKREFDFLISTIPLPELIRMMHGVPERIKRANEKLLHTSILNLCFGIDQPKVSDKHWVYIPEGKFLFYRVGFPSNFSPESTPKGMSSVTVEIAYRGKKPGNAVDRSVKGLREMGLIKKGNRIVFQQVIPIPYAYVIYDRNYKKSLDIIHNFLSEKGIYSIGRFGGWQYTSIEDVILEGKKTADKIKKKIEISS
jgi:UDP-galactopyranose mutase